MASVRKQGVYTGDLLNRVVDIDLIFGLIPFLGDGVNARRRQRFVRISRRRVAHP